LIVADARHALGRSGEAAAEAFLARGGLRILERRFRVKVGEIDLIGERDGTIVFVEVKTRSGSRYGTPAEGVTALRRLRLARAAETYLARHGWTDRPCRFDVVEVFAAGEGDLRVNHIEDAFRPG
jgi:putative endonuclease